MKPIIGVTTFEELEKGYHSVNSNYIKAVFAAGGIPVNIPIIHDEDDYDRYLNLLDGIVLTGGIDLCPLSYNENPLKEVDTISSIRDKYEIGLFKKAYEKRMPILGICRGLQIINVCLGGNLYQDINKQVSNSLGHAPSGTPRDEFYHMIRIKNNTKLYNIFGRENLAVNSLHHQSIKELGENLIATAFSEDGIIEAIEAIDDRFLMGVQFHPESFVDKHPEYIDIFKELISVSKTKRSQEGIFARGEYFARQ